MKKSMLDLEGTNHSINWLESTRRSIESSFLEQTDIRDRLDPITERLSALFLDRLPPDLARSFLDLLPTVVRKQHPSLEKDAGSEEDTSIGYPSFVEEASLVIGAEYPEDDLRKLADAFLWAIVQGVPGDMKNRLTEVLPLELRSRMDLYSASDDHSRVA